MEGMSGDGSGLPSKWAIRRINIGNRSFRHSLWRTVQRPQEEIPMKITTKLAIAAGFAALAACSSNNNANNVDMNATDMNAGMTDYNTTDINATTTEMNATGNVDMNATNMNATANTSTNNTM
jgi:hypothetical protein